MINELVKETEKKDEAKLMNAIHQNYKNTRMNRLMDEQIKEITKKESENAQKKMMWVILLTGIICVILEALAYV